MQPFTKLSLRPNYTERKPHANVEKTNNSGSTTDFAISPLSQNIFDSIQNEDSSSLLPPQTRTQLDLDKLLTARILAIPKNENPLKNLLHLALNSQVETKKNMPFTFNSQHWTAWFQELAKLDLPSLPTSKEKADLQKIYNIFLSVVNRLDMSPFQNVSITRSLSELKAIEFPPSALNKRMASVSLEIIQHCSDKEITMLLRGAKDLFSDVQKTALFEKLEEVFPLHRFKESCFHTKVTLLNAFTKWRFNNPRPIWNAYLNCTIESYYVQEPALKEILAFLRVLAYQSGFMSILLTIESKLADLLIKKDGRILNTDLEFIGHAISIFAIARYLPKKFIPSVVGIIKNPETPIWTKMYFLETLGKLGYHEILPYLKIFLCEELIQKDEKRGCAIWETIYANDLVPCLRSLAYLYPESEKFPPHVEGMVKRVIHFIDNLSEEHKLSFFEICCVLGFKHEIEKVYLPKNNENYAVSSRKEIAIQNIADEIQLKFKNVTTRPFADVGGRNVDLLFNRGNKKSVICQIDNPFFYFCCNDTSRLVGKTQLRNKFLSQLGYVVYSFSLTNDLTDYRKQMQELSQILKT